MGASSGKYGEYEEGDEELMANTMSYFTPISLYRDWLDSNMKDPQYCQHGAVTN